MKRPTESDELHDLALWALRLARWLVLVFVASVIGLAAVAFVAGRKAHGADPAAPSVLIYVDERDANVAEDAARSLRIDAAEVGAAVSCAPWFASRTAVWYVPTGSNTSVLLVVYCSNMDPAAWYVSWFDGDQPDLWGWYEIQNTAGSLLRRG